MIAILLDSIRSAFEAIRANGLRSFLTTLGIIISVAAIIAVISIIQGLSHTVNAEFEGLGADTLTISSHTTFSDAMIGRFANLGLDDLRAVQHRVPGISHITPILFSTDGRSNRVSYRGREHFTTLQGVGHAYMEVSGVMLQEGRFFNRADEERRRFVCLIGMEVADRLELPDNGLGSFIQIGNEWCRIIGVLEPRGEFFGISQDNMVLLPFNTMQRLIGPQRRIDISIQLRVVDAERVDEVSERIRRVLRQQRGLSPGQRDDFRVQTAQQLTDGFNNIVATVTAVAGGIVGISLLVGGIGIMNIMLVSVTERTREIGILKALGATRSDILLQFLIEAVVLSLLGGLIGLGIGYGIGALAATLMPGFPPAHVPIWAIFLAVGFSASVGIVFGILPAAKAAQLDPTEALRYE